ncbi:MAG: cysteine desulfurase family protein [Planctomycetota bacterium]|nr:cysteine desulfurase family protein [Planctomycetota bacterium]
MTHRTRRAIYLDYNASTPVAPEVWAAMRPFMLEHFGNPSAAHWAADGAREAIGKARGQVAELLGAQPDEIVFTSSGSESNNTVLKSGFHPQAGNTPHYLTTAVEHPSIHAPLVFLEQLGAEVTYLPVDSTGLVDPRDVEQAILPNTVLISVMHANNETGTIQPVAEIASVAHGHGVPFHTDAAQSIGKIPVLVDDIGVDFLTVAGHKFYAPKGVGALYVRDGAKLDPLIHGGGHQNGRRASTESAFLIVALGAASELAYKDPDTERVQELRDRFLTILQARFLGEVVLNGHPEHRLPNTVNVSFLGHSGQDVLARLDGVAASTGSACHAGHTSPSATLAAMGVSREVAAGAIRFSLGRQTTVDDVETVARLLEHTLVRAPLMLHP